MSYPIRTIGSLGSVAELACACARDPETLGGVLDVLSYVNPASPNWWPGLVVKRARARASEAVDDAQRKAATVVDDLKATLDPIPIAVGIAGGDPTWGWSYVRHKQAIAIGVVAMAAGAVYLAHTQRRKLDKRPRLARKLSP